MYPLSDNVEGLGPLISFPASEMKHVLHTVCPVVTRVPSKIGA